MNVYKTERKAEKLAESYIFFKQGLEETIEQYKAIYEKLLEEECPIEELDDDSFMCNNMNFYEISDLWCVGDNIEGNDYCMEHLLELAGDGEIIYLYFDEDMLAGELVVIRQGQVVRKLYDYYDVPELNVNEGRLEDEDVFKLDGWVSIASYSDYLFENL